MDFKSPGTRGSYVDLIKDRLKFTGSKEMSSYFLRDVQFLQKEVDDEDLYNKGTYVQGVIILGRRLLSIMTTIYLPTGKISIVFTVFHYINQILIFFVYLLY